MASSDWIDEFVEKLTINDYFKLMTRVKDRFTARPLRGPPRRPWSQNANRKKLKGAVRCAIEIAAQGEFKEFLHDLAEQYHEFIKCTGADDDDMTNLLANLKVVYDRLQNKGHEADSFRATILQCLRGVRGYNELKTNGWEISEEQWIKVGKTVEWSQAGGGKRSYES